MRLDCPHCHGPAVIRTSKALGDTVREASVQCENVECAHTWVARIIAERTIAPSMKPNPRVYIPLSPRSPAAAAPADSQLELPMEPYNPRQMATPSG
ncbi:MAG TPA: ogr/Delta-like zinc finger family protein [Rhodocyclaceae bacterium]|nr:ogr/Delta-like zinc finger family protein [Rhodocyclaceae bacterium]